MQPQFTHPVPQSAQGLVLIQCLSSPSTDTHTASSHTWVMGGCWGDDNKYKRQYKSTCIHRRLGISRKPCYYSMACYSWQHEGNKHQTDTLNTQRSQNGNDFDVETAQAQFPKINALEIDLFKTISNSSILTCFVFGH